MLGEAGRKVRCAKCGNNWHAMPADVIEAPPVGVPATQKPVVETEIPQLQVIPPVTLKVERPAPEPELERPRRSTPLSPVAPLAPESAILVLFRQFFPIASLVFLAVLLSVFVLGRMAIAQKAPWTLAVYNMIALSPLPPGGGISIINVRDESRFGAMDDALVLSGQLVNQTPATLKVPLFKLIFTNPVGQVKTFMARSPVEKVDAGASVPFRLERAGFAQEGWNVKVTFGDGSEGDDTGKPMQTQAPAEKK